MDGKKLKEIDTYDVFTEQHLLDNALFNQPFYSEYFAIMLVRQGELNLSCNLNRFSLVKGSLFFVAPKLFYEIISLAADTKLVGIVFNSKFISQNGLHLTSLDVLRTLSSEILPHYELSEEDIYILQSLFNVLLVKAGITDAHNQDKESALHCVLAVLYESVSIYKRHQTLEQVKLTRKEAITLNFLQLLSERFMEERSAQYYADSLFITPRHLSHVVKEITGKSARELIDDAVIMQAKILLATPSYNIAKVSESLQFSDQSFFGKFFKKRVGITPSDYRINSRSLKNSPF